MKAISFAWTTAAFQARRKTVTRREWKDDYARSFKKNEIVAALNKVYRAGGRRIGLIRLTCDPYKESESLMPDSDYEAEGYAFLDEHPEFKPVQWHDVNLREKFEQDRCLGLEVWVVRFEILSVEPE